MASGQLGNLMRFVRRLVHAPAGAERTDRQLLERFAEQRDEAAFAELVARHGPMVFNVCRRVLDDAHAAEDAFQAAFLVLARKAVSLHWHESVGNWLYETAFRTATKAKGDHARRRAREQQSAAVPRSDPMPELDWRELRGVLDQELSRLPAKYRSPLVLCYLEGKSNEEAARLLGWPTGTVSGRLARARDLLRDRLTRRGLALSAGTLGTALSHNVLEAAVPATLAESAVQSAVSLSSGSVAAGSIAAPVTRLTEGVLQAMFLHQLKTVASLILLLGVVGAGMGLLAFRMFGQPVSAVPIGEAKPQPPMGGKEVNGLKLSLTADQTETVMKADGSDVEPVKLKLTFTNVGDQPIKFDAYVLQWYSLRLEAVGPDAQSLEVVHELFDWEPDPAKAADFLVIEPGASWSFTNLKFPGSVPHGGSCHSYFVRKPGEYRLKFTYDPDLSKEQPKCGSPLAKGAWIGALTSNQLVLKVKPADAGKEVNGLKLSLSADKTETVMQADGSNAEPVQLKLTFQNASGKPHKLAMPKTYESLQYHYLRLEITGPDAQSVQSIPRRRLAIPTGAGPNDYQTVPAKQSWTPDVQPTFPPGPFKDQSIALLKPGQYRLKLTYENTAVGPLNDWWTGTLTSNELVLTVKPAGGKEVNGLKLSLTADQTETVMKADGSNAEPVMLSLNFTNVSDKPIKIDGYDVFGRHLNWQVIAPDAQSMEATLLKVRRQLENRGTVADYPEIKPGEHWTAVDRLPFPGTLFVAPGEKGVSHAVRKPGQYRLSVVYESRADDINPELVAGTWQGKLTSNEVLLTVKPAGTADQGEKPAFRVLKEMHSAQTKAPAVVLLKDQKSYQTFFEETFAKHREPKPRAEAVDFQTKQVVAVCWGDKPSTLYDLSVVSLTGTAAELVLTVKTTVPKGLAEPAITHPAVVVEIPRCDRLKVVVTGDRTPAGKWYQDFVGSTSKELDVHVK